MPLSRWIAAASFVAACFMPSHSWADGHAETDEPATRLLRARQLFPQADRWFRIVGGQLFTTGAGGSLVPRHETLTHPRVRRRDGAGQTVVPRFPARFRDWLRITSSTSPDAWVEVAPTGAADVEAVTRDGLVFYPSAYPSTDVVFKSTPTHTDEYLILWTRAAPARWQYRIRRGPSIRRLRQIDQAIEAIDANDIPWLRTRNPVAVDVHGRRAEGSIRLDGDDLVLEIDLGGLVHPILVDPDWRSTGDMAEGRFFHRSVILPDGRMLVTGGCSASVCSGDLSLPDCRNVVRSAEALDLTTRTFSRVTADITGRFFHVAEALPDGRVLVAGGCATSDCRAVNASAAILDPSSGTFREITAPPDVGAGMISARLPDGRILVAGGCIADDCTTGSVAFEPDSESWIALAPMRVARGRATVTTLLDGSILVAGGCRGMSCSTVLADAEVYDPNRDVWESTGPMATLRAGHFAASLPDGRVLVGGGCADQACARTLRTTEVFDRGSMAFAPYSDLVQPRFGAEAIGLGDGTVMISQGCAAAGSCDLTNELLDPVTERFSLSEPAVTARAFHTLVAHEASRTIIANGGCQPNTCSWWNETYDISALTPLPPPPPPPPPPPADGGTDASAAAPDGGPRDGASPDARTAGVHPYTPPDCVCRATGARTRNVPSIGACLLVALALALVARARHRRRRSFDRD